MIYISCKVIDEKKKTMWKQKKEWQARWEKKILEKGNYSFIWEQMKKK